MSPKLSDLKNRGILNRRSHSQLARFKNVLQEKTQAKETQNSEKITIETPSMTALHTAKEPLSKTYIHSHIVDDKSLNTMELDETTIENVHIG